MADTSSDAVPTKYARSGGVNIAYQVLGNGPLDLVFVPMMISHLELAWEEPSLARFYRRLASFSRLILFDKRGYGLSDRVAGIPTLEERMDDIRAVMDAVGSERAALFGASEGATMSALFSATYPERISSIVLYGAFEGFVGTRPEPEQIQTFLDAIERSWGQGITIGLFAPSRADDDRFKEWWARFERLSLSPGASAAVFRMNMDINIRDVLPTIRVPTLVIHRTGDRVPAEAGRHFASQILGAKYVELPGIDHAPWVGDADTLLEEVQEFITGIRPVPEADRVLATVLFTDVVGSTERAAELGDRRWREVLESYYGLVRMELGHFRGQEIKTTGDGVLATFDGPVRAVRCACAISERVPALGIETRAGLHTGECEIFSEDIGGIAVHIAHRVAGSAAPNEVLVSSTVKDLVYGSGIGFQDRGLHLLRGVPEQWHLFGVERLP